MKSILFSCLAVFSLFFTTLNVRTAQAAGTVYADATKGNTSQSCGTIDSPCKNLVLAYAHAANEDTIQIAPGTYTGLVNLWPVKNITLNGSGTTGENKTILDGGNAVRVLYVFKDDKATVKNLIIQNGTPADQPKKNGGGVYNNGTLTLNHVLIQDNHVPADGMGGGIFNNAVAPNKGSLKIENSAVVDNTSGSYGAGLYNDEGKVSIINSTFSDNEATAPSSYGGAIYSRNGSVTVVSSTLANNSAVIGGGAINRWGSAEITLLNTLVANNKPQNCNDKLKSTSHFNLESGNTCGFDAAEGDLIDTDAQLADLSDGGAASVHALPGNSPAVDKGNPDGCLKDPNFSIELSTDQRDLTRKEDGDADGNARCDIGAFEYRIVKEVPVIPSGDGDGDSGGGGNNGGSGGKSGTGETGSKTTTPEQTGGVGGGGGGLFAQGGSKCSLGAGVADPALLIYGLGFAGFAWWRSRKRQSR